MKGKYSVISHFVDFKTNKIELEFREFPDENVNIALSDTVKEISPEKFINNNLFNIKIGELVSATANIYGGMEISKNSASTAGVTVGMSAERTSNGLEGIITCGHSLTISEKMYLGGNEFGTVNLLNFANNGTGDWSFVRKTSDDTLTNKIYGTSSSTSRNITGTLDDRAVGMTISGFGRVSNYYTATVNSQNQTITLSSGETIKGITKCTLTSGSTTNGDSGGPLYSLNTSGGNSYNFIGVNTGKTSSNIFFTPYVRFKSHIIIKTS